MESRKRMVQRYWIWIGFETALSEQAEGKVVMQLRLLVLVVAIYSQNMAYGKKEVGERHKTRRKMN